MSLLLLSEQEVISLLIGEVIEVVEMSSITKRRVTFRKAGCVIGI